MDAKRATKGKRPKKKYNSEWLLGNNIFKPGDLWKNHGATLKIKPI